MNSGGGVGTPSRPAFSPASDSWQSGSGGRAGRRGRRRRSGMKRELSRALSTPPATSSASLRRGRGRRGRKMIFQRLLSSKSPSPLPHRRRHHLPPTPTPTLSILPYSRPPFASRSCEMRAGRSASVPAVALQPRTSAARTRVSSHALVLAGRGLGPLVPLLVLILVLVLVLAFRPLLVLLVLAACCTTRSTAASPSAARWTALS